MKSFLFIALALSVCVLTLVAQTKPATSPAKYDYRTSEAYTRLADDEKRNLAQVQRDFAMLWGALDMYADEHAGQVPESLDALVPLYLDQLPTDPFANKAEATRTAGHGARASLDGRGYWYRMRTSKERAWCISSLGLPTFPYLAATGNIGLYVCKGNWI